MSEEHAGRRSASWTGPRARSFRLLAVALALLLALAAAEVVLRLTPPSVGYRTAPLEARWEMVDSELPRARSHPSVPAKPAGAYRLVTIGDSYTWGDGVYPEDTYAARLARRLSLAAPGVDLDLVNLSRPGWNTFQEHWWFSREIDRLEPDLAILGFCLNDAEPFDEEELAALQVTLGELAEATSPETVPGRGPSVLLGKLSSSWSNLRSRRRVRTYYESLYDYEPGWSASRRALRGLGEIARQRSFPILMVIFPIFDSQLDHRYSYRALHERARRAGEEAGLPVLDLLPSYAGVDARRLAVVPFTDPHPNELAHRIAADAIAGRLLDSGMFSVE